MGPSNAYLVMDNCAIHKTAAALNEQSDANVNIVFLPEYSTWQLNPIELLFKKVRRDIFKKFNWTTSMVENKHNLKKTLAQYRRSSAIIALAYKRMRHNVHLALNKDLFVKS